MTRYYFGAAALAAALSLCAGSASAVTLLNQLPDPTITANVDQQFGSVNALFSTYLVDDVTLGADVTITSVEAFFTNDRGTWPGIGTGTAVLNIFEGTSLEASDDPTSGGDFGTASQTVTFSATTTGVSVLASGLSISLDAGSYFFGLTPILGIDTLGQEFHEFSTAAQSGTVPLVRNPGGSFGVGTDWATVQDAFGAPASAVSLAMVIEGDINAAVVPLPPTMALGLAGLGMVGMARFSRRRRA